MLSGLPEDISANLSLSSVGRNLDSVGLGWDPSMGKQNETTSLDDPDIGSSQIALGLWCCSLILPLQTLLRFLEAFSLHGGSSG